MALLQGRWFDFSVEPPNDDDFGAIWLEDRYSREQWECVVDDYARFTRDGELLTVDDVLHFAASWLESSKYIPPEYDEPKIALRNVFGDKYLIVPIQVRTRQGDTRDFTYTFPLQRLEYPQQQHQRMALRSGWQDFYQKNKDVAAEDNEDDDDGDDEEELRIRIGTFENRSHPRAVGRLQDLSSRS